MGFREIELFTPDLKTSRKRFVLVITVFLLVAASARAEPVTLRYKTSPGDLFYFADESTTLGSIRFISATGELLNTVPFDRKSTTNTRMDTVKVEGGAATIHIYVEKYRMTDNGALTVDYDREKGIKQLEGLEGDLDFLDPHAMTIDERGNVLNFEILEKKEGEKKGKFDWKKLSTVMQIAFPEEPVDIGDEWINTADMVGGKPSPFDIKGVTRRFKLVGFEKMKGLDCARIRFEAKIENAPGLAQDLIESLPPDADAEVESSSLSVESAVYFARAEGVLVALETTVTLRMNLSIDAPVDDKNQRVKVEGFFKTESAYELE